MSACSGRSARRRRCDPLAGALTAVATVAAAACAPDAAFQGGQLAGVTLVASAALEDDLSGFQIALVRDGSELDCLTVQRSCLKQQIADPSRYVPFQGTSGELVKAEVFDVAVSPAPSGGGTVQELLLKGITVGKDYALVVEALTRDTPPRLAGSACAYVAEVTAGLNAAVTAPIEALSPTVACDARIAP